VKEHCGVQVSYGTLHEFIQRRSRPRKPKPELEPNVATTGIPFHTPKPEAPLSRSTPSTDPYAEARERMRRFKEEPPPRKPEKRFHYTEQDSIDPLVLIPQTTKEK
jgi:hypothetical protein